jgi:outer membrane lipoprotein SlyB
MKCTIKHIIAASFIALAITGCAPSISPDTYTTSSAGQVNRVVKGVIDSSRVVELSGDTYTEGGGMVGTLAGGALGAVAGSTIGQGTGSVLAAIGGGLVGAGVGNMAEKKLTQQQGMEYVVKTKNGAYISVVQGLKPTFQKGQHVMIIYGNRARVVADPDYSN